MDSVNSGSPILNQECAKVQTKFQYLGANEKVGVAALAALVGVTTFFGLILTGVSVLIAAPVALYVGLTVFACVACNVLKPLKLSEKEQAAITVLDERLAEVKASMDLVIKKTSEDMHHFNDKIKEKEIEVAETVNVDLDELEELNIIFKKEFEEYRQGIENAKASLLKEQKIYKTWVTDAFKILLATISKEKQAIVLKPYQENYSLAIRDAIGNG